MAKTFKGAVSKELGKRLTAEGKEATDKRIGIPREERRRRSATYKKDREVRFDPSDISRMLDDLARATGGGCKSPAEELRIYRHWVPVLVCEYFDQNDTMIALLESVDAIDSGMGSRSRKRWTEEEDNKLIDMAADGASMSMMGFVLDRTPTAIQTRISYLVGIERLSQEVAGKFIGWLNGELVEGEIDGTVSRERK